MALLEIDVDPLGGTSRLSSSSCDCYAGPLLTDKCFDVIDYFKKKIVCFGFHSDYKVTLVV